MALGGTLAPFLPAVARGPVTAMEPAKYLTSAVDGCPRFTSAFAQAWRILAVSITGTNSFRLSAQGVITEFIKGLSRPVRRPSDSKQPSCFSKPAPELG